MRDGKTISFAELVKYVLSKWRIILGFIIVFAILAGAVGCLKAYMNNQTTEKQEGNTDYSQYEEALTENEIQEVKDTVDSYLAYEKIYLDYKGYMSNSIKMQLDANSVPTKKVVYQISNNADATNIADVFIETVPDSEISKEIVQNLKLDVDESYIKELITIEKSDVSLIEGSNGQNSSVIENNISNNETTLFTVKIISDSEDNCETIGNILDKKINKMSSEMQNRFGNFALQKVNESFYEEADSDLLLEQQVRANEMYNTSTLMRNLESTLSEQQKAYFDVLLDDNMEEIAKESSSQSLESTSIVNDVNIQYINIKYILVGAFGGLVLSCFYILCKLFFNNRLVSDYYILEDLQAPLLGVIQKEDKGKTLGKKIDYVIETLFWDKKEKHSADDKLKMICTDIQLISQKNGINKIFITSSVDLEKNNNIIDKLSKELEKFNINFSVGKSILNDEDSLKKCVEMDGVIFVEIRNESLLNEISNEIESCKKYGLDNLGFIIID